MVDQQLKDDRERVSQQIRDKDFTAFRDAIEEAEEKGFLGKNEYLKVAKYSLECMAKFGPSMGKEIKTVL